MRSRAGLGAALLALLAGLAGGCGKPAPTVDPATERKQALERSKEGAFGTQVKALETAKGLGEDMDKKAREAVDKAEQGAK
jgi:hypothetical protein